MAQACLQAPQPEAVKKALKKLMDTPVDMKSELHRGTTLRL